MANNSNNQDYSNEADGFILGGGTTERKLTVSGGDVAIAGSGTAVVTLPTATSTLATLALTETLTNKTITAPVISSIVNTGTLTLPTSTDTLVGKATTDTLTNKTISTGGANSVSAAVLTNPYKFSVYRAAAITFNGFTLVACDTKSYDTSSNVDVVTNKGRFTAPIAGFYHFTGRASITSTGRVFATLYKNGVEIKRGEDSSSNVQSSGVVSGELQLAANDYVELYFYAAASSTGEVGAATCYFDGHLISIT